MYNNIINLTCTALEPYKVKCLKEMYQDIFPAAADYELFYIP